MQFITRKRRQAPTVIIISLIDILIVLLIFLMVTTTFKKQPSMKLALPEARQAQKGANQNNIIVTITPSTNLIYINKNQIPPEQLEAALRRELQINTNQSLAIRADDGAPFGLVVKVMDAAKVLGIRSVNAFTRQPDQARGR